jgi:hypothetical protein
MDIFYCQKFWNRYGWGELASIAASLAATRPEDAVSSVAAAASDGGSLVSVCSDGGSLVAVDSDGGSLIAGGSHGGSEGAAGV